MGAGLCGYFGVVGHDVLADVYPLRWVSAIVAGSAAVAAYALPLKINILTAIASVLVCLLLEKMQVSQPTAAGKGH